jgi:hypothetical protein
MWNFKKYGNVLDFPEKDLKIYYFHKQSKWVQNGPKKGQMAKNLFLASNLKEGPMATMF